MIKYQKLHIAFLFFLAIIFVQENAVAQSFTKYNTPKTYLDSIKATFVKDKMASCVDSLWMKELTNLDIYNDLESDIKNINLDKKVDYELPTELLKARLKEMDARSPFNIEYNQALENIIKSFLKNRKKSFERLMAISEYYFPIIEDALSKQNVPLEIKYLAVVESALNPKAVSKVGATGLWQFMYQTGKQYNLNIDSYVDDRSNPLKSSEAAAQYMTNMYKIFGDWDLVLASYNSGPGNVAKAIRRSGGHQNYWNIRKNLPLETQGYIPAFLATMYIYEYHTAHGIIPKKATVKQFATDTIMIKKQMTFKQISDLLDIPVAQLQLLNPQYKLNVIPAYVDQKHFLTLPIQKIAIFTSNEEPIYAYVQHELDQREKPFTKEQWAFATRDTSRGDSYGASKIKFHKVKHGDNLNEIASIYGVTVEEIKNTNKLKNNNLLLGRKLKIVIPTERIASKDKKEKVDTLSVAKTSDKISSNTTAVAQVQPKETKVYKEEKVTSFKEVTKIHKVKKGENLSEISNQYGVTVADIKKQNKLKHNNISFGKELKITTTEKVVTTVKKLVKSENIALADKSKKEQKSDTTEKQDDFYVVQQGDNLGSIAKKFNVSIEDLKQRNNLSDNTIQLESKLKISDIVTNEQPEATPKTEVKNIEYIVQKGDNLSAIAKKNGVAVSDLKTWNDLSDDSIHLGQKMIVAKKLIADENQAVAEKSSKKDKIAKKQKEDHYYVRKGDSLFSIAKKYPGITINDIKKWNGINGNELKPGMKLKING